MGEMWERYGETWYELRVPHPGLEMWGDMGEMRRRYEEIWGDDGDLRDEEVAPRTLAQLLLGGDHLAIKRLEDARSSFGRQALADDRVRRWPASRR